MKPDNVALLAGMGHNTPVLANLNLVNEHIMLAPAILLCYTTQGRRKLFHSGGAAFKGQYLCILIAKSSTWVNIQNNI